MKTYISIFVPLVYGLLMPSDNLHAQESGSTSSLDTVRSSPIREIKWDDSDFSWPNTVSSLKSQVADVKVELVLLERDRSIPEKLANGEQVSMPVDYVAPKNRWALLESRMVAILSFSSQIENYMGAKTDAELVADQVFGKPGEFQIVFKGVTREEGQALLKEAQELQSKWAELTRPE